LSEAGSVALPYRKGIGLIFPNLDVEIGLLAGSGAATQTSQEMSAEAPGRVLFSL